jgi:hypothetical protein
MAHRDAVVDRNRIELLGNAAGLLDLPRDELPEVLQMHMPRHELRKRVDHRDDRLAKILVLHPGRAPQPARPRHVAAVSRGA